MSWPVTLTGPRARAGSAGNSAVTRAATMIPAVAARAGRRAAGRMLEGLGWVPAVLLASAAGQG